MAYVDNLVYLPDHQHDLYLAYFFLEQSIKTIYDSRDDPQPIPRSVDPFWGAGYYVMKAIRYLYILSLTLQFVLSLGNRP